MKKNFLTLFLCCAAFLFVRCGQNTAVEEKEPPHSAVRPLALALGLEKDTIVGSDFYGFEDLAAAHAAFDIFKDYFQNNTLKGSIVMLELFKKSNEGCISHFNYFIVLSEYGSSWEDDFFISDMPWAGLKYCHAGIRYPRRPDEYRLQHEPESKTEPETESSRR